MPAAEGSAGPAARSHAPKLPWLRGDLGFSRGFGRVALIRFFASPLSCK